MLSNRNWLILFAVCLLFSSGMLFLIHYEIFHDAHHIFIYSLHDLAFLPIEVLLVTLILDQLLERQATKSKLNKLNMVIGVFFSEIGTPLMRFLSSHDPDFLKKKEFYISINSWNHSQYAERSKEAMKSSYKVHLSYEDLTQLKNTLIQKEEFLVRLLENPILLEHESFTDALRAVFHLVEELNYRKNLQELPESDLRHLSGDITRVYSHIIPVWLSYLKYLKENYPYLFSLAVRTNPFTEIEDPIVRE